MDTLHGLFAYGVIVLLIFIMIAFILVMPADGHKEENSKCKENFKMISDFKVFNYLTKHPINVQIMEQTPSTMESLPGVKGRDMTTAVKTKPLTLIKTIKPSDSEGMTKDIADKYLKPGNIIKINILKDGISIPYVDYVINTRQGERIKNLHIGMVTTRFIANTTDNLHLTTNAANAGSGSAWVIIHNTTNIPLELNNGEIKVDPHSTFRYLGYLNQGVTLGTYFKDDNGMYPEFQYLQPHSDLYYGIVSDLQQATYGCLQYEEFNDQCDYGDTLWPFQNGIY